ncbi:MAG: hypothetical protein ACXABO_08800 [Promethearchaeota archaeon]|jgi:hypothetical protein
MTKKSLSSLIIDIFGLDLYQKSLKFPRNKINIFFLREHPLKIRSIILDNEREYHFIIDEKNNDIFHDCPLFLIHSERSKKICIHLIKLLLVIKEQFSNSILRDFDNYTFISDDIGSRKKGKNFQILANKCLESNNSVEALNYMNKVIVNQYEDGSIIEKFLKTAVNSNLFIEFFEFLEKSYDHPLQTYLLRFNDYIEKGFEKFLSVIHKYSFYNLLKIIESIDRILEFKHVSFIETLINILQQLINSSDFNENYFSIYFIKKYRNEMVKINPEFKSFISRDQLNLIKNKLLSYFLSEIDNFCLIEKLKILKKQFKIIGIPKDKYDNEYQNYKFEIKQLEKKLYLKKFSFLKLLMEKYSIRQTKGEFRKKRNAYIVNHNDENLNNPVYDYIISRIGFFGLNEQTIKSSEIGLNYFIMKELFLDNISAFQDVNYYKTQFWGENDYIVNSIDGFPLLSKNVEYSYDGDQKYSKDVNIIEWDLSSKPIQGSIVSAYGSQILIPDRNNPLFHDLNPFDLCYCKKTPIKIESSIIKTVNVITKCSFKDAIKSISLGMTFIEGFYPLSLVKVVMDKEINPFQAYDLVINNPNKSFIPNYTQFIQAFRDFLYEFIFREKEYIFEELKSDIGAKPDQVLLLLNLKNEVNGLKLPYSEIFKELIYPDVSLHNFKSIFLKQVHHFIRNILNNRELGNTEIFDLKKLRNTPFYKYSNEILSNRKEEFESTNISKTSEENEIRYDISEIKKTYYGKNFLSILHFKRLSHIPLDKFKKFRDLAVKLNLNLTITDLSNQE